ASPHVQVNVGVAVVRIEIDRPGFAPKKLRTRGQNVVVEAVRRSSKKRWIAAGSLRAINPRANARPVSHCNGDVLLVHLRSLMLEQCSVLVGWAKARSCAPCPRAVALLCRTPWARRAHDSARAEMPRM